jgi:hypothetical protein
MKKRKKKVVSKPKANVTLIPPGIWSVIERQKKFYVVNRKSVFGPYKERTVATQHAKDLNSATTTKPSILELFT